jgi:SAM-dependent methyltransferase
MTRLPATIRRLAAGLSLEPGARILDYGSADAPYRRFFPGTVDFVTADLPGNPRAGVEVRPDGGLPVGDASFDAVLSTQVLEHVVDPALYLAECYRALRPGGRLVLSTHGIMVYHADPDDYWRWTHAGLRKIVGDAGFEVEKMEGIMGLAATGLQFIQETYYWRMPRLPRALFALFLQSLMPLADRYQGSESLARDALVFALVARKPGLD